MKNIILIGALVITAFLPLSIATAGLRSDWAPVGDAVGVDAAATSVTPPADTNMVIPNIHSSLEVPRSSVVKPAKAVLHHPAHRIICDPVVFVLEAHTRGATENKSHWRIGATG